jgi:lipoprotein-anchoring transpeptidase ErfK/SrfK
MNTRTTSKSIEIISIVLFAAATARAEEAAGDRRRIVVSIPDQKLVLIEDEAILRVYDIAVGKPSTPSPEGQFRIVNRIADPTWYGPRKIVPPGKSNPLGTRWMGLSVRGYGIHGTNAPNSIGKRASHGCIRMRNRDVEELFELVPVGALVELLSTRPELFQKVLAVAD